MSDILLTIYYVFPALLNIEFFDPPTVVRVFGSIGNSKFRWELSEIRAIAQITNTTKQQAFITTAFERMATQLTGGRNRRLVAAAHYFHVACRLLVAGQSPWEFMGEVVLNFTKTLQALFGQQGEDVREGLRRLGGYSAEEIEAFVTVIGLRDNLDSSHIMLSVMTEAQAAALNRFVYGRELQFRKLLTRVFDEVGAGRFTVNEDLDLSLDADKVKLFGWIEKANQLGGPHARPPSAAPGVGC